MKKIISLITLLGSICFNANANEFPSLPEALPIDDDAAYEAVTYAPRFKYDDESCFPGVAISGDGVRNSGLSAGFGKTVTGSCRASNHHTTSNVYHRYMCKISDGNKYCGHMYTLYFEKDVAAFGQGHRHDWEFAIVWTTNGLPTHVGVSHHGNYSQRGFYASNVYLTGTHPKIVYHSDGGSSNYGNLGHPFRFASNEGGWFSIPPMQSYYSMKGYGDFDNQDMRDAFNSYSFGDATYPMKDSTFVNRMNTKSPSGYPMFTSVDRDNSK